MKKNLHFFIISALLLCEALFFGGGNVFADPKALGDTDLTWDLTNGVLTIDYDGNGEKKDMPSYNASGAPWYSNRTSITAIVIQSGVTSISNYAFYNCSNATSVTIPLSVTSFGSSAFYGCSKITTVKYASSATNWANINFANSYATPIYYAKRLNCSNSTNPTTSMSGLGSATVHKIKQYAFYNDTAITSLTFNASVDSIAANAFNGCKGIKSITITANMKNIAPTAFSSCSNLATITWNATNYTAPTGYSTSPFYNPNTYIKTFKFGASVTNIPAYVCYGMTNLEAITLPTNTATIGQNAFQNCSKIAELEVPSSVTSIGAEAFKGCTGLTKILARPVTPPTASANTFTNVSTTIPITVTSSAASTAYSEATGWSVFTNYVNTRSGSCGASANWELDYAAGTLTITGSGATTDYGSYSDVPWIKDTSFIFTASVANAITRLGHRVFYGCQRLTSVSISNSQLTSIGQYAFYNCKRLAGFGNNASQINIPKDVTTLENYAFQNCSTATKVYMFSNSELTTIGTDVFENMSSLTDIAIYNCSKLTTIGGNAFKGCSSLANITLPASITSIGSSAFANCTSLTPENGKVNFKGTVDQWASISYTIAAANPASLTQALYINNVLLTDCELSVNPGSYTFYNNKALTSLTLNEGITSLGSNVFYGCSNIESVTFPTTLETINSYAFQKCSSLTSVDFTNASSLTTIGSSAFWEADITGSLYIPASVNNIGGSAFRDNSHITAIFATPTTAPSGLTSSYTFLNVTKTIPFYVPTADAMTSYQANAYWNEFTNMKVGGSCGATGNELNVHWEYNSTSHLLTISGTGAMKDYANSDSNRAPWYDLRTSVNSIKICDGVTHVGKFAFHNCSNATEVWMTTTVTECGNSAFMGCSDLANVKYGKTNTTVLSYATDWAQITFGNYQANPLSFAHTLQVYKPTSTMPAWGTVIAFENRDISQIKKYAFYGCTSLTSAVLPSNVESIGESAFYGCTNLATVTLPDALTTIGKEAFKNCSKLPSITIPENVTVMTCHSGNTTYSIFGGCTNLTTIVWNARNCASDYIKVGTSSGYNYGTPFSGIYSQITSITFGENVERIPNFLCYHMDHLTSVTIPSSVTNIGTEAFNACSGTMSVICEGATPPILADNVFSSPSTKKLYLPHDIDVKAAYRAASGWSSFTEENTYPKIVQFDLNGKSGTIPDPQFFDDKTSKAAAPAIPADDGYYTFDQWTTDASGASPFTFASTNITADLTLYAKWTENIFSFADTDTDNSKIADAEGKKASSVTIGRTVWKDGYYNTLCLPFSLSADEIATSPLAGYKALKRLSTATVTGTGENRVLNIQLEPITAITAGEPFLISYEAGGNITNPVFNNVTVTAATPGSIHAGDVTCHGIYARTGLGDANTNLFLGTNNTLYWPQDAEHSTMNGLRAYFSIDSSGPAYAGMRVRLTDKPAETPTGIDHDAPSTEPQSTKILRDGVLLILRDGKTYSAQGVRIQ